MPIKLLHIADTHIGMENYGRLDPSTGLHTRVQDFVRCLRFALSTGIEEQVDLVVLNKASPLLAHEVVRNGKLVFCRDPDRRVAFETDAFRRYVDTEPLRRIQAQYLERRIAEGKFGLGSLEAKATEAAHLGANDV